MHIAIVDCGTTNTRVYIVTKEGTISGKARRKVGVRDASINGGKDALKHAIKTAFDEALSNAHLLIRDVDFAISFGGITSEIGLIDLPHLEAPCNVKDISTGITAMHDTSVFPIDVPVYFIRGIKNNFEPGTPILSRIGTLDFMRGEETQIAGLITSYDIKTPLTVVMLSSHTKFISIDEAMNVLGGVTTLSGQLYEAVIHHTFVGKSVKEEGGFHFKSYFDGAVIDSAYDWVQRFGFLRSVIIPRILDILLETEWWEREFFLEACFASEDLCALQQFVPMRFPIDTYFILIGRERRCSIYEYLLRKKALLSKDIMSITEEHDIETLSIKGALYLVSLRYSF
jgi:2-dehydro-3-deoxygalactonokinase